MGIIVQKSRKKCKYKMKKQVASGKLQKGRNKNTYGLSLLSISFMDKDLEPLQGGRKSPPQGRHSFLELLNRQDRNCKPV